MSNKYTENRKKHLEEYADKNDLPVGGSFRNKTYGHILDISKSEIEEYNFLSDMKFDLLPEEKIHMYAHHLNSSQVLCYNYFRPILNDDRTPKQELIDILKDKHIAISKNAICTFEYKSPNYEEQGTVFDFHIKDEDVEIFFEIKYTEDGFSSVKMIRVTKISSRKPIKT